MKKLEKGSKVAEIITTIACISFFPLVYVIGRFIVSWFS